MIPTKTTTDEYGGPVDDAAEEHFWKFTYGKIGDEVSAFIDANREFNEDYEDCVIYSAWDSGEYRNNLHDVAVHGHIQFVHHVSEFWCGVDGGVTYVSEVVIDPTWLDLCLLANDMMNITGDKHHCYLEAISRNKDKFSVDSSAFVEIYKFSMGS